jgi:hypothetical protein
MLLVRRRRLGKKVAARSNARRKDLPDKDRSIVEKGDGAAQSPSCLPKNKSRSLFKEDVTDKRKDL